MQTMKKEMLYGFLIGLTAPILILLGFYQLYYYHITLWGFVMKFEEASVLTPVISLCVLINLGIFKLLMWKDKNNYAKGVIFATFIYAFYVILNKLEDL